MVARFSRASKQCSTRSLAITPITTLASGADKPSETEPLNPAALPRRFMCFTVLDLKSRVLLASCFELRVFPQNNANSISQFNQDDSYVCCELKALFIGPCMHAFAESFAKKHECVAPV
jgi:hypothetical protein